MTAIHDPVRRKPDWFSGKLWPTEGSTIHLDHRFAGNMISKQAGFISIWHGAVRYNGSGPILFSTSPIEGSQ